MAQTVSVIVGAEDRARLAAILGDRNRPLTVAEEPMSAAAGDWRAEARETVPGRIEMDLRSGRLVFHGAVDPGLAAAVIAAARGRG